jgi:hypothetical protein
LPFNIIFILIEGFKGFGAPGKLSSGQFSAENGRKPRKIGKPPFIILLLAEGV